jgi:predicted permease
MMEWCWNSRAEPLNALLDVILPVFLVLGFGYVGAWRGWIGEAGIDGLMKFTQGFAIPCLLFSNIAKLDLATTFDPGLFASFYIGAFLCFGLGAFGARYLFQRPATDSVAIGFCCLFSNSVLLGLPIMERAYGPDSLAGNYAIVSLHAPVMYAVGIATMEIVRSNGQGLSPLRIAGQILRGIASNALVIGIGLGFVVNITGVALPTVVWSAVDLMVRAALPAALFGLGGVLFRYRPEGDMKAIAMVCVISLIVHPAIVWVLARYGFALTTAQLRSAVVTAAMAPGVNAYLFANMYGAARRVAASSVLISTAAAIGTVWFWLGVLP